MNSLGAGVRRIEGEHRMPSIHYMAGRQSIPVSTTGHDQQGAPQVTSRRAVSSARSDHVDTDRSLQNAPSVANFARRSVQSEPGQVRAGTNSLASVRQAGSQQQAKPSYASLVGSSPLAGADPQAQARDVVAKAKRTAQRLAGGKNIKTFFTQGDLKQIGKSFLGINQGADQTANVYITENQWDMGEYGINVFDRAGYHVMEAIILEKGPGELYVDSLMASHGRNCGELRMFQGGKGVPGRGNARLVAVGLETLILKGSACGIHKITCRPASQQVAELYAQMGFAHEDGKSPTAGQDMVLDLTNLEAVQQALVTFSMGRSMYQDVPKNVQARLEAAGEYSAPPSQETWVDEADSYVVISLTHKTADPP